MPSDELLEAVKRNLVLDHDQDDGLIAALVASAISYACGFQHLEPDHYDHHEMSPATVQAVVMLSTHFYESRDGSTAGFFNNQPAAAEQTWRAIHRLLILDRDWKV